jgi:hypothetical protein
MNRRNAQLGAAAIVGCIAYAASSLAAAPPGQYSIVNGTVKDNRTGLTWQQAVDWNTYTLSAAQTYCQNLSLDGTSWRLPTCKELLTLIDPVQDPAPAIDPTAFPGTPPENFWTSVTYINDGSRNWLVDFNQGYSISAPATQPSRVRCVR